MTTQLTQLRKAIPIGNTHRLVLDEVRAILAYPIVAAGDGYIRAFHVRYFRRDRTPPAIRALPLPRINAILRDLARHGDLERHPRRADYKLGAP